MIDRLKTLQGKVEYILETYPITRDDDAMMVCAVYGLFYDIDMNTPFKMVMTKHNLPSFETIGRCRRKAQAENPNLRGKRDKERLEFQKDYVEYALSDR